MNFVCKKKQKIELSLITLPPAHVHKTELVRVLNADSYVKAILQLELSLNKIEGKNLQFTYLGRVYAILSIGLQFTLI